MVREDGEREMWSENCLGSVLRASCLHGVGRREADAKGETEETQARRTDHCKHRKLCNR